MTKLLVSVRNAAEAKVALEGGADVIDVKEPRNGALGAAEPQVWQEVLSVVRGEVVTSAALGELHSLAMEGIAHQLAGFDYVKVGLSDFEQREDTAATWFALCKILNDVVRLVPVVYADVGTAESFMTSAMAAVGLAGQVSSFLVVVDTFDKRAGNLLDHATVPMLRKLSSAAARADVRLVLAGSLNESAIERVLPLRPAYIGVRGAACAGGRDGTIDLARVKSLARIVRGARAKAAS